MLVRSITSIDDMSIDMFGQQFMRAAVWMTHHNHIWIISIDGLSGVNQAFTFLHTARRRSNIKDVGALIFCSQLKGRTCSCAVFIKQIDNGNALQRFGLFHAAHLFAHVPRQREDLLYLFNAELIDTDKISMF